MQVRVAMHPGSGVQRLALIPLPSRAGRLPYPDRLHLPLRPSCRQPPPSPAILSSPPLMPPPPLGEVCICDPSIASGYLNNP